MSGTGSGLVTFPVPINILMLRDKSTLIRFTNLHPECITDRTTFHMGNFDDWEAFKPKVEIWTDYKSSWLGKFDCVAEAFVDNGTLDRIQMFMENLDQRE